MKDKEKDRYIVFGYGLDMKRSEYINEVINKSRAIQQTTSSSRGSADNTVNENRNMDKNRRWQHGGDGGEEEQVRLRQGNAIS